MNSQFPFSLASRPDLASMYARHGPPARSPICRSARSVARLHNSIAQRQASFVKVPRKRHNQRKCIEGIIGIGQQCFGLEQTRVRGLENVKKDTLLKGISMLFVSVVAAETGVDDAYLRPTFFFG
nr:hypothetical protein [Candidatus Sigynarchaeum springense]MDO8118569.1 hypothetical protein [Candidatus Sigynarchaeota archaeon]